jgi:hypothetical protein
LPGAIAELFDSHEERALVGCNGLEKPLERVVRMSVDQTRRKGVEEIERSVEARVALEEIIAPQ